MKKTLTLFFLLLATASLYAQVFSTPTGAVSSNSTTDVVLVNGQTVLKNPTGRTLLIERDDEDSWLTFHDPGNYWYSMGIDRSDAGKFKINYGGAVGDLTQFTLTSGGDIGIGTSSPSTKLQLKGGAFQQINADNYSGIYLDATATDQPKIGWRVSDNSERFRIHLKDVNSSSERLAFYKTITGEAEVLSILASGNVGIGINSPDSRLAVNGTIHSKEVKVDMTGWPDYVFKKEYKILSLSEIKAYIDKYEHLPEIPSASEVESTGANLGEMNKLLLKKIEELTLHMIDMDKRVTEVQHENAELKKQLRP